MHLCAVNADEKSSHQSSDMFYCAVLVYVGLVSGRTIIRTSQDMFFSAIVIEHHAMTHSSVVRQILPVPAEQGSAYLSCGDDGRVLHTNINM